ncbi:MAG: TenA family protein [Alphaproteobacteria bacterium]|nr:TenA family protein [Alphaproteobacteria bacterium]MDX5370746.1 TenA family protein [Alphaproteobacteria bacterium]MDX5465160.1 TenA family protein [Alphaproteobacteria bacterium]
MSTPSSYAEARAEDPGARPTDLLVRLAQPHWDAACGHRFTRELGADTLSADVFARYAVQDHLFVTDLASVLGHLIARAPDMAAKHRFAAFAAMLTSEENDFFLRTFDQLGIDRAEAARTPVHEVTRGFAGLMLAAAERSYAQGLACLLCAEWCYLTWGVREAAEARPRRPWAQEWIDLHAVPAFRSFVEGLRAEMDRTLDAATPEEQEAAARAFRRMTELEVEFFDAAYA